MSNDEKKARISYYRAEKKTAQTGSAELQDALDAVTQERDELQAKLNTAEGKAANLEDIIRRGTADNERLIRENGDLRDQGISLRTKLNETNLDLDNAKAEYADYVQSSEKTGQQYQKERDDLQVKLTEMESRINDLQTQLDAAKSIPDDALSRLEGVKGIGKDLAQKALDALTAIPIGK